MTRKEISYGLLFTTAVLFLFFFWLGKIPVWSGDEGRYSEIAREMLNSRDFIVPYFNYTADFEKPILAPLLTAFSMAIFGVGGFAARFPSVVAALLGIGMTYFFTRRWLGPRAAWLSALILSTSIGFVLVGRFAMIDMLMMFFISAALFSMAHAFFLRQPRYYLLAYVFMGLALVTKGLIGIVLPALTFSFFLLWTGNLSELKKMKIGWGILIIGTIFIPWGVAISMREPEFSYVFFMKHHISRFATGSFGRRRPFWFFLPILFAFSFPWSVFLPAAMWKGFRERTPGRAECIKFLICWVLTVFVFFSIPKSKLPYYLLPLMMPLAILIAAYFETFLAPGPTDGRKDTVFQWTWGLLMGVGLIASTGLNLALLFFVNDVRGLAVRPLVQILWGVFLIGGLAAHFFYKKGLIKNAILSLAATVYTVLIFVIAAMYVLSPFLSTDSYARLIAPHLKENDIIAIYSSPDHFSDLPFNLRRRVVVAGSDRGTLDEESRDPDDLEDSKKWYLDANQFADLFNSSAQRVFCLVEEKNLPELQSVGLHQFFVIKKDHGKILVVNQLFP